MNNQLKLCVTKWLCVSKGPFIIYLRGGPVQIGKARNCKHSSPPNLKFANSRPPQKCNMQIYVPPSTCVNIGMCIYITYINIGINICRCISIYIYYICISIYAYFQKSYVIRSNYIEDFIETELKRYTKVLYNVHPIARVAPENLHIRDKSA